MSGRVAVYAHDPYYVVEINMERTDQIELFEGTLEVISGLSGEHIRCELAEMRKRFEIEEAVREAFKMGVSIDALSEASGFCPADLYKILDKSASDELAILSGIV